MIKRSNNVLIEIQFLLIGRNNFHKQVIHEAMLIFDYCPLILLLESGTTKSKFLFQFESKWLMHLQCSEVIQEVCSSLLWFCYVLFYEEIIALQISFECLSSTHFQSDFEKTQRLQQQLEEVYYRPFDINNANSEAQLLAQFSCLVAT